MPHQWKRNFLSISSGLQKPCRNDSGPLQAMLTVHAAATHNSNGSTVKARVRKELSEAGLVATPDQPTSRKPDFAGGPCFLLILFSSPSSLYCFSHVASPDSSSSSSAKLCFGSCFLPPFGGWAMLLLIPHFPLGLFFLGFCCFCFCLRIFLLFFLYNAFVLGSLFSCFLHLCHSPFLPLQLSPVSFRDTNSCLLR